MMDNENEFSFAELSTAEQIEEKRSEQLREAEEEVVNNAANCLNSGMFNKYRVAYGKLEKQTIECFISLNEPDPIKYASICRTLASRLSVFKGLSDMVKLDMDTV